MIVRWLMNLFLGYVIIRAEGDGVEKLLNLAVSRGILFWDIRYMGDKVVFKTYPDNFPLLRPLSRKAGCSLRIQAKAGFPFLFYRFKKRRGLVAGLIFFFLFLYTASNFIWFIEVKGLEEMEEAYILKIAGEVGLTPGTTKRGLDFESLEREFLLLERDLAWVGFEIQGARLVIVVTEKTRPPEDLRDITSDLVANRDGLIEKVLVLSGEARAEAGDTVQRGQVLISGTLTASRQEGDEILTWETGRVRARGEVFARVWYEFFAAYPLTEHTRERTGERAASYALRFLDREVFLGPGVSPYRNYEVEEIKRQVKWRNLDTPIEFMTIYYYELSLQTRELSGDEALFKAREELFAKASAALPAGVEVVSHEVEELPLTSGGQRGLRLIIETRENIAEEREHEIKEE